MFAWISRQVYAAFVGGIHRGMVDTGLIESDAAGPDQQAQAVRAALAPAVEDKPRRKATDGK